MVIAACWLLKHGYVGITHDAQLYTAQALSRLHPGAFAGDLFLMPGSQEEFTLFSRLWAPYIDVVGLGRLALLLVAAAHVLWVSGAVRLFSRLLPDAGTRNLALIAVCVLPSGYGGLGALSYGEGFLTPRVFSEALLLHGLAWLVQGRIVFTLAAILTAGVLHPLLSLAGAAIVGAWLCWQDRRWIWVGVSGLGCVLALAWYGVQPFDRLALRYDPDWLRLSHLRCTIAFPGLWAKDDWNHICFQAVLIGLACLWLRGLPRRLFLMVLVAGMSILAVSAALSMWGNVLVTQLQLWRILWVVAVFANAATGYLIATYWRESPNRVPLVCLVASAWCWEPLAEVGFPLVLMAAASGVAAWKFRDAIWPRYMVGVACVVTGLTAGFWVCGRAWRTMLLNGIRADSVPEICKLVAYISLPVLFLIGALVYGVRQWNNPWRSTVLSGAAAASVLVAVLAWDRRTQWQRWSEAATPANVPFASVMKANKPVFWSEGANDVWLLLRRASWFSNLQTAGLLFSRETALEAESRSRRVKPLDNRGLLRFFPPSDRITQPSPPTASAMVNACRDVPRLEAIISGHEVRGIPAVSWQLPTPRTVMHLNKGDWTMTREPVLHLYRCSDLRPPALLSDQADTSRQASVPSAGNRTPL